MKCAHCSAPVPDDATFCHKCGSAVSDAEGQAAATAAMGESHEQQLERMLRAETGGEFEVERLLGKGGMALVYLAKEVHLDRMVAVKVLPPELTFGHGVERFKREAKTAAALDHPHIIPIHRIAAGGKLFWYTMKYVEGRSLEDYLKQYNQVPLDKTIDILMPVADALDYAHEHQVIHRDIKPANVMLDERNRVTVADFGIAKALTEATLTASGSVIGTPYYMSPEQGMGKPVSGTSDQYSVAVMAYRMLSGQVPFDGDSAIDILHKHCKEPPPQLRALVPNLPRHVYLAIDKALSKSPDDRFTSVTAFVKGLKELSPEISAEMDTVAMSTDPSMQEEISTKVIGIRDEDLVGTKGQTGPGGVAGETIWDRAKRAPWLVLVPTVLVIVSAGIFGGVWLSNRQAGEGPENQVGQAEDVIQVDEASGAAEPVPALTPPAPTTGTVTVTGLPPAGTITIDGERQTDTVFELDPGEYAIVLSAPGAQAVETELTIAAGSQIAVPYFTTPAEATTGTVTVTDLPRGGQITVDGRRESQNSFELERGTHTVRLTAPGYQAVEREITVNPGTESTVQFTGQALVAGVSVNPARSEIEVGEDVAVTARTVDAFGNVLRGRPVQWTSRNTTIATVNRAGVVHGVSAGNTAIVATVEDQSASFDVTVTAEAVGTVNVSPANSAVFEGEAIQLNLRVLDASGNSMSGQTVRWRSSDEAVATVSSAGVVTGVRAGSATIIAQTGGQVGQSTLTVKAAVVEEQVAPEPEPREITGPEDLFTRAAPEGWQVSRGTNPVIAVYNHQELGTIRIFRSPGTDPETILGALRTRLEQQMNSVRELGAPEELTTEAGESVLVQRLDAREGSSFAETRWEVFVAAVHRGSRSVGVIATFVYYGGDRERAYEDLQELMRSLRR